MHQPGHQESELLGLLRPARKGHEEHAQNMVWHQATIPSCRLSHECAPLMHI